MPEDRKSKNKLLSALSKDQFGELFSKLEYVPLVYDKNIYDQGEVISHVYFPESGIISLLASVEDDYTIEVGIIGDEGIAGLSVFLGVPVSGNRAVVQGAGFASRMETGDFLKESRSGSDLSRFILRYMHSLFTQVSQSAACNRYHSIDERLARWLLMTRDRMHQDEFQITQGFLSNMLGVRREAVNRAAKGLQQRDLIKYARGSVSIIDGPGLEKAACRCYDAIEKEYNEIPV